MVEHAEPESTHPQVLDQSEEHNPKHWETSISQTLRESEVFCSRFNFDGGMLANSYMDGALMIVNPKMGYQVHASKNEKMTLPITRLAWKHVYYHVPETKDEELYGSCLDGNIVHWSSAYPGKLEHHMLNSENQYNTIDADGSGTHVVVAGKLHQIEIWNIVTMKMEQCWNQEEKHCHDNTIFTARYFPFNSFLMYSGGWDRNVKFWDVRHHTMTMSFHGS
jgi:WD40 repeat protein